MQITEEQIRRLMRYANVSEAEARQALEQADGDLLNALELLMSRTEEPSQLPEPESGPQPGQKRPAPGSFWEFLMEGWRFLVENRLEAYLPGTERRIECPIAALIPLLFLAWYAVLFFVVLGVCFGWRFHFVGPQLGKDRVNQVVSDLDDAAESLRDTVKEELHRRAEEYRREQKEQAQKQNKKK